MWELTLPLKVRLGNKNRYLNLNYYRNAHFHILNAMKVQYGLDVQDEVAKLPKKLRHIHVHSTFFLGNNRLCDIPNLVSISDKFILDVLVNEGVLEDDNYTHVPSGSWAFGGVDKSNPRVVLSIYPVSGPIRMNYQPQGQSNDPTVPADPLPA